MNEVIIDKKCIACKFYMDCYNSNQRHNEEIHDEDVTTPCNDYKEY